MRKINESDNGLPLENFTAILFDMDGVLCDSEPFITEAAMRMFAERYGRKVRPHDFHPFVGTGEDRFLGGVAEKYGIELRLPEDKNFTYRVYLDIIRDRLQPLPGVHRFIGRADAAGLKLAVASSADRIKVEGNLKEIDLPPHHFGALVSGDDISRKKPHPEIFLTAAQRLDVDAADCLVVEDAPSGILAGCRAGARCLGITSTFPAEKLSEAGAEWTAPDLSGFCESAAR